ncbi:MAG TPA: biopolymer transporter ExbD [Elusimicrobiota bacterium]|nr:biopolymer transporter ExbD [Elusimicrobiota bacterium]
MAGQAQQNGKIISGINVTPLVDITLVLLIIFMATSHIIAQRAMKLNLPKAANTAETPTPAVSIMMSADRALTLNGQPVTRDALAINLKQLARLDPNLRVTLAADKSVDWDSVAGILDDVRGAGISRMSAQVAPK